MARAERALISVTNKQNVDTFAKGLCTLGIEVLSTGGTAAMLKQAGVEVTEVADYTGFPELLGGRLKTLHPKVHGGILCRRDDSEHLSQCADNGIPPIDIVVGNLYAFAQATADPDCTVDNAVEHIDIGGPTLLRAAAKNFHDVTVIVDPNDYPKVLEELKKHGETTLETRFFLARKVFAMTGSYDMAITRWLTGIDPAKHPYFKG